MDSRNFFQVFGDWLAQRQAYRQQQVKSDNRSQRMWLPQPGNVLFTLLVIGSLIWTQQYGVLNLLAAPNAQSLSTGTIAYQGRLADSSGNPLTSTVNMTFRFYTAASGGVPLWEEGWTGANSVLVSDGLFNVMLGSLSPIGQSVITGNNNLFLGITVGTDSEMSPRVQLGSVPFAAQALTVPDGSITATKLASDVSLIPLDGSVTTEKLAEGAATGYWFAKGTSNASTNSTSLQLIPEMNLEVTTTGKPVEIIADIGFKVKGDPASGYTNFSIFVDGQEKTRHSNRAFRDNESTAIQLHWVDVLSAGTHTVEVKWYTSSGAIQLVSNAANNVWEQRFLTVHEYRR